MSSVLQIDLGMTKYHLDQLKELKFAQLTSASQTDTYWIITPNGRRHVVERKLIGR